MDKISALMDGELDAHQAQHEFARLEQSQELRQKWNTFHLIGDALRGERLLSTDLAEPLEQRLTQEPTVLAPRRRPVQKVTAYALSAAASVAAVALVSWLALSTQQSTTREEVAVAPPVTALPAALPAVVPVAPVASVPDEGRTNEYLLAHQAFSPSTAIQGVVPYIRSVSTRQSLNDR